MNNIVDNVATLEEKIARVRAAQQKYSTYTQEQVDKIFLAAAIAAKCHEVIPDFTGFTYGRMMELLSR